PLCCSSTLSSYPPSCHDSFFVFFFSNGTPTTVIYTLSLHDALPICASTAGASAAGASIAGGSSMGGGEAKKKEVLMPAPQRPARSEEHTSELQSRGHLVCRLLLEKKKKENV